MADAALSSTVPAQVDTTTAGGAANPADIAHLLRRAGWGGTPAEIQRGVAEGIAATIDRLFDIDAAPPAGDAHRSPGIDAYKPPDFIVWWYRLAVASPTAGIERLAWFWHGHFATALTKVRFASLLRNQLVTLRRHGLGRFDDLLELMSHDTAMNLWLDLYTSVVGRPNENFARELMELFSLGIDGGYTQHDVSEAARAFTGYGLRTDPTARRRPVGTELHPELHDYGQKTVLGVTGALTGSDVIAAIVERSACHRHIVGRMWLRYAGTSPPDSVIDELAAVFASRLDVGDLTRAMLTHPDFYSSSVKSGLVAQPVETLVRALRNFEVDVSDLSQTSLDDALAPQRQAARRLLQWSRLLGQLPGLPPNVGGWPHNDGWLTTDKAAGRLAVGIELGAVVARAETTLSEQLRAADPSELVELLLRQFGLVEWSDNTAIAAGVAATSESRGVEAVQAAFALVFASPEVALT